MLRVAWRDAGDGRVAEALASLPDGGVCPHDTYLKLLRLEPARVAVVSEGDAPLAVIGVERVGPLALAPITNWLYPGETFPCVANRRLDVLASLGSTVRVAHWRTPFPQNDAPAVEAIDKSAVHRMDDLAEREVYWASQKRMRDIRKARERTAALDLRIGVPDIAERVLIGWHTKWNGGDASDFAVRSRVLLAETLEPLGRHLTVGLFDQDEMIAGSTNFIHGDALVAGILYVPNEHRRLMAGIRLIEEMFNIAADRGYAAFDLGGGADYKAQWAPAVGERAIVTVAPPHLRVLRRLAVKARGLLRSGTPINATAPD